MKRSLDSDEEIEIDSTKKSKTNDDDKLDIDDSYYIIRRSKSSVSSSNLDDKIETEFNLKQFGKSDRYSSFSQRDRNRFTPFNKNERNLSSSFYKSSSSSPNSFNKDKSKSTSSLNDKKTELNSVISNLTSTSYNIKLPSNYQSNIGKKIIKNY